MDLPIDRETMVRILVDEYPSLREALADEETAGLTCPQLACFTRHVRAAIDAGDRLEVRRAFETARRFYLHGDGDVSNAIGVAFLEHLNLEDGRRPRAWARGLLPSPLAAALDGLTGRG